MARTLSRRGFAAGAAAFAGVAFVPSRGDAAEFTYKYGSPSPPTHPLNVRATEMWNAIKVETNGRLDVTVFPNSVLGGDTAMLTQLRSGAIQFLSFTAGILANVVPVAGIESVGFVFKNDAQALATMDGPLGDYVRGEIGQKGMFAFPRPWLNGFRQITTSTKPVHVAGDLNGFKIRTPAAPIWVDLFKSLGASPTPMNFSEVYTALQTHVIDGQENPLALIETSKLYEVQKYLSLTNHMWSGYWLLANADAWTKLPKDVQDVVSRNVEKSVLQQRKDVETLNATLADRLKTLGMTVNVADPASFRAKLAPFYASQQRVFGDRAWGLLEKSVGKLT